MIVLAIDTALSACSAAVLESGAGGRAIERVEPMVRGHAEELMPLLGRLLAEAELSLDEVDRFGVTIGPGTFTGVRVGVAAVRGFALALGRPAVGITTLAALAETARLSGASERPMLVAMDARRGEIYAQSFAASGRALGPPIVAPPSETISSLDGDVAAVFGTAALTCVQEGLQQGRLLENVGQDAAPAPVAVARLALRTSHSLPPAPLYLRPPDARPQAGAVARW